jgi:hypothetical protein
LYIEIICDPNTSLDNRALSLIWLSLDDYPIRDIIEKEASKATDPKWLEFLKQYMPEKNLTG